MENATTGDEKSHGDNKTSIYNAEKDIDLLLKKQ
jgi:hypothetical protein